MITTVVGWDASASSRIALDTAARLAAGGRVVVVHAREPRHAQTSARWQELAELDADERSRSLLEQAGSATGVDLDLRSAEGPAAEALQRVADEVGADAIVVGSRGLGDAAPLTGSVSSTLLREATRPIVVIPPRAR